VSDTRTPKPRRPLTQQAARAALARGDTPALRAASPRLRQWVKELFQGGKKRLG